MKTRMMMTTLVLVAGGTVATAEEYYTINTAGFGVPDKLVRVDLDGPSVTEVGSLGIDVLLTGMAFSPTPVTGPSGEVYPAGTLWAYDGQGGDLFTVDLTTGVANVLGQIPGGSVTDYALTFDLEGNLYTSFGASVRQIDPQTLTATSVGSLPFSNLDEWDVLEVPQQVTGYGTIPAGMLIANVGGNAQDNVWLVDPSDWSGIDLGELPSTEVNWSVATGPSGAIYSSGAPAISRTVSELFLDPLATEFIIDTDQPAIYGGDVIPEPATLGLLLTGCVALLGRRR